MRTHVNKTNRISSKIRNNFRLSEMMGRKLEENNPQITNLNDPNRTQKLAEMLGDIYDNDWTDTFSELQSELPNMRERQCADILMNVLKV